MERNPDREKDTMEEVDAELDPFEINFIPQFLENRGPRKPFVNSQGVVIGDHEYESEQSPLNQWSVDTDPSVMAGDEWVHPFKDVGFHTAENKNYFENGIEPQGGIFMHPDKDVAYEAFNQETGGALGNEYSHGAVSPDEMKVKPLKDKDEESDI